jgi:hypothetical protein
MGAIVAPAHDGPRRQRLGVPLHRAEGPGTSSSAPRRRRSPGLRRGGRGAWRRTSVAAAAASVAASGTAPIAIGIPAGGGDRARSGPCQTPWHRHGVPRIGPRGLALLRPRRCAGDRGARTAGEEVPGAERRWCRRRRRRHGHVVPRTGPGSAEGRRTRVGHDLTVTVVGFGGVPCRRVLAMCCRSLNAGTCCQDGVALAQLSSHAENPANQ